MSEVKLGPYTIHRVFKGYFVVRENQEVVGRIRFEKEPGGGHWKFSQASDGEGQWQGARTLTTVFEVLLQEKELEELRAKTHALVEALFRLECMSS